MLESHRLVVVAAAEYRDGVSGRHCIVLRGASSSAAAPAALLRRRSRDTSARMIQ
jgi:hypothetical protein